MMEFVCVAGSIYWWASRRTERAVRWGALSRMGTRSLPPGCPPTCAGSSRHSTSSRTTILTPTPSLLSRGPLVYQATKFSTSSPYHKHLHLLTAFLFDTFVRKMLSNIIDLNISCYFPTFQFLLLKSE